MKMLMVPPGTDFPASNHPLSFFSKENTHSDFITETSQPCWCSAHLSDMNNSLVGKKKISVPPKNSHFDPSCAAMKTTIKSWFLLTLQNPKWRQQAQLLFYFPALWTVWWICKSRALLHPSNASGNCSNSEHLWVPLGKHHQQSDDNK